MVVLEDFERVRASLRSSDLPQKPLAEAELALDRIYARLHNLESAYDKGYHHGLRDG